MSQPAQVSPANAVQSVFKPFADLLLARNKTSAVIRLSIVGVTFVLYWFIIVVLADFPGDLPIEWQVRLPSVAYILLNTFIPFFHPRVLVHLLPAVAAILGSLFVGSLYLTDLFELDSFWVAANYLVGALFGLAYPTLTINSGDIVNLEAQYSNNPLLRIGGPGYVNVHLGFAAVFETEDGLPRVYGPLTGDQGTRKPFIEGFERLRGVVDLRDQIGKVDEVRAVTRDGIEVYARDAQMLFRVHSGGQQRSLQNPYPYTEDGIRRLVYGQAVKKEMQLKWEEMLPEIVSREIRKFVARHTIEEFLALQPSRMLEEAESSPGKTDQQEEQGSLIQIPRRQLSEHFHTEQLKQDLQNNGLELAWVGVGTWEVRDDPFPSTPSDTGPAKTLMATWRDLQRANLYNSADYQVRERDRCLGERTAQGIQELIRTWKHGELPKSYRCFEMLSVIHQQLNQMLHLLETEPELNPPPDINLVIDHIRFLIRSKEIGDDEA